VRPDVVPAHGFRVSSRVHRTRRGQAGREVRHRKDTMRMVTLYYVAGLTAVVLLGVGTALAEPTTTQTLVAMSLLTGEDQKPPPPLPHPPRPRLARSLPFPVCLLLLRPRQR